MDIKLVKGTEKQYFPCAHVTVKTVSPESQAAVQGLATPGVYFELSTGVAIALPQDGDSVFFINDKGVTIDAYYWPLRPRGPRSRPNG